MAGGRCERISHANVQVPLEEIALVTSPHVPSATQSQLGCCGRGDGMVEYAVAPGILKRREALGLPHDGLPIPARLSALCPEVGALEVLALIFIRRTHEGVTAVQAAGLRGAVAWRLDANRPENPCLGFGDSDPRRAAR